MNPLLERFERINKNNLSDDSWLVAVLQEGYIVFQTVPTKYWKEIRKIFAIDLEKQKLVLDMLKTEEQSPHKKIELEKILEFHIQHISESESYHDYIFAMTHDKEELKVSSRYVGSTRDIEEMAMVLGAICNKRVWRRLRSGEMILLPSSEMLT